MVGRHLATWLALAAMLGCSAFQVPEPAAERHLQPAWQHVLHLNPILSVRPREPATAAIDGKRSEAYIGSNDGVLFAYELESGRERWHYRTSGPIWSAPLLTKDALYVGTGDGSVVALVRKDGTPLWEKPFFAEGAIGATPALAGGRLFITLDTNEIRALDAEAGDQLWRYSREHQSAFTLDGHAASVVWKDSVLTGFSDGVVTALRAEDGAVLWERSLGGERSRFHDVDGTLVIVGDTLYVSSNSGGVYALDPETGEVRWHHDMLGASSPVVVGDRVYVTAADERELRALERESGRLLWRTGFHRGTPSAPVVAGDLVFVSATYALQIVSAEDGRVLARYAPVEGISAPPAVVDGWMVALTNKGHVHAMRVY